MAVARSGGEGVDVVCTESQGDDKQTLEMEGGATTAEQRERA